MFLYKELKIYESNIHSNKMIFVFQLQSRKENLLAIDFFSVDLIKELEVFSYEIMDFFSLIFPLFLDIAIIAVNLSLISGGIIYLLDYNEENGKKMVFRSSMRSGEKSNILAKEAKDAMAIRS